MATRYPLAPSGVIMVLGSPSLDDGRASPVQISRCAQALAVWRRDPQPLIGLLGAAVKNEHPESVTMADWLKRAGVPADRLWTETATRTTRDQALLIRDFIQETDTPNVTVVSSSAHLRRTRMLLTRAKADLSRIGFSSTEKPRPWRQLRDWIYEATAWSKDWTRTLVGRW